MDPATLVRETVLVPRKTERPPGPDDWAAERIRYERDKRGWSTAELARRVTLAGVPIRQPQVWQIESGTPRRKLTVGEAVAFANVFGISLRDLMTPPAEAVPMQLVQLAVDFRDWMLGQGAHLEELRAIDGKLAVLDDDESYTADQVAKFSPMNTKPAVSYLEAIVARLQDVLAKIRSGESGWDVVAGAALMAPPPPDEAD